MGVPVNASARRANVCTGNDPQGNPESEEGKGLKIPLIKQITSAISKGEEGVTLVTLRAAGPPTTADLLSGGDQPLTRARHARAEHRRPVEDDARGSGLRRGPKDRESRRRARFSTSELCAESRAVAWRVRTLSPPRLRVRVIPVASSVCGSGGRVQGGRNSQATVWPAA